MLSESLNFFAGLAVVAAGWLVAGYFGVRIIRKNKHVSQLPDEDFPEGAEETEEVIEIPMGLCATKAGKKTHYRKLGKGGISKRAYLKSSKPTLCGVWAKRDLEDQDAEASCKTCREALSKFAYPFV